MSTKPAFQAVGSVPGGSPECNYKVKSSFEFHKYLILLPGKLLLK
jgi:hypothetical protein